MATSMDQSTPLPAKMDSKEPVTRLKHDLHEKIRNANARFGTYGVHSSMVMTTAGFRYTRDGDTTRCDTCHLEVSGWTKEMKPFVIHAERNPKCPFVRSLLTKSLLQFYDQENPTKRQKTDSITDQYHQSNRLIEVKKLKAIRRRTFSQWPHRTKPSAEQMIAAGFFACNVGDRVVCIYCNLICQQWASDTDDPTEVHKTISPLCPYVLSMLIHPQQSSVLIVNEISSNNGNNQTAGSNNTTQPRFDEIVYTAPCHAAYSDITKRLETFATWSNESSPPVDDLIRAGFFYTGAKNIVTCFYCNGSLQNWGTNDNPTIEHVRWFSHCAYAKQLCGDEVYRKVQEAKRARQERERANQLNETNNNGNLAITNHGSLQVNDPNILTRYVAARLDLSISQSLLEQNFSLSVIKRCWEDQLQLKQDDFVDNTDLLIACIALQKQIDHIKGNKDNIIIPNERMRLIRTGKQVGLTPTTSLPANTSNDDNIQTLQNQPVPPTTAIESTTVETNVEKQRVATDSSVSNPCLICCKDEKRLACIPCGHFTACVPCSHSLRTCPMCRREIEAFVRIYL